MITVDRFGVAILGLVAACLLATTPTARAGDPAGTPTRLLLGPGSVVPGSPAGTVTASPQRVVYGDAGWAMNITMVGFIEQIVSEDGIGVYEGQELPGGITVNDIWLSLDSDSSGRLATTIILAGGVTAITIDDALALRSGDPVPAAGLQPGSTWAVLQSVDFDTSGHLAVLGTVAEPSAPGNPIDAIVRYDVDVGGALGNPVVMLSQHDLVEGRALDGIGYISDLTFARNDADQLMHTVFFVDGVGQGSGAAIVLDGVVLAEDGTPSPFEGRDWIVGAADPVALNAQGDYAFRARIEAGAGDGSFDVIVHNGAIVAIESSAMPGLPGSMITRLHAPRLADDGTLLYLVEWSEGAFIRQGFVVDGQLAVATVATQIEGETLSGLHNDAFEYDLSADGTRFSFVGYPATGGWGAYEAPTGPWQDLAGGLAGTGGVAPTLFGLGSLEPGSVLSLQLAGARPGSLTNLVIGLSQLGAPFHGGVMVPSPDVLLLGLPVNAAGALNLSATLPGGLPSSLPLYFQFWSVDAGGPTGYSASNALVAVTP
jgi:hypothetical protein